MTIKILIPLTGVAIFTAAGLAFNAYAQIGASAFPALNNHLSQIERHVNGAESAKSSSEYETRGKEISESLEKYAKAMLESANIALMEAEKAAKSNGKEGGMGSLKSFEDLGQIHERKLKQLEDKLKKTQEKIEKLDSVPNTDTKKTSGISGPTSNVPSHIWSTLKYAVEYVIPSAKAAILIPTITACNFSNSNSNSTPNTTSTIAQINICNNAVALAHSQRVQAQNDFAACWGAAHHHKLRRDGHIHWIATMHLACTATLVARLA